MLHMVSIRWPADNSHDIVYSNAGVAGMRVSLSLLVCMVNQLIL